MGGINVTFMDIVKAGGLTLAVLIALSIFSIALIWHHWNLYKKSVSTLPGFVGRLRRLLEAGKLKDAAAYCKSAHNPAGEILLTAMGGPGRKAAAERLLEREVAALEKGLPILGTIGSTAPFIGLFGTVLGVMRAFRDLAGAANAGPGVVAVGISEALVATAAGLFVAIPAIVAYNYFTARANHFNDEVRWVIDEILDRFSGA